MTSAYTEPRFMLDLMNLFFLSSDPQECAEMHADKHVVKSAFRNASNSRIEFTEFTLVVILETAQLLSTAHRVLDGVDYLLAADGTKSPARKGTLPDERAGVLYKVTHVNHPCAKWVRVNDGNYLWAFALFTELCDEYTYRYNKVHATTRLTKALATPPTHIKMGTMTAPALAMPDEFKIENDAVASYRNYYKQGKQHLHAWKKRSHPLWIN